MVAIAEMLKRWAGSNERSLKMRAERAATSEFYPARQFGKRHWRKHCLPQHRKDPFSIGKSKSGAGKKEGNNNLTGIFGAKDDHFLVGKVESNRR